LEARSAVLLLLTSLLIRFYLAYSLFRAGSGKLRSVKSFMLTIDLYAPLPRRLNRLIARAIPRTELYLTACLAIGLSLRTVALLTSALILAFASAIGVNLTLGRSFDCGCAGEGKSNTISWRLFAKDMIMASSAIYLAIVAGTWSPLAPLPGLLSVTHINVSLLITIIAAIVLTTELYAALRRAHSYHVPPNRKSADVLR
jgi:uncharacterized membrane protein YphA (DoxX/SURF4 family)